jgi:hypothetical protein
MDEKSKNLMIVGRFILGLGIIGALEYIVVVVKHSSPILPVVGMIFNPALIIVFLPPLVAAVYFMFSSKMRWRIDIILFLLAIAGIVGASSFNF